MIFYDEYGNRDNPTILMLHALVPWIHSASSIVFRTNITL